MGMVWLLCDATSDLAADLTVDPCNYEVNKGTLNQSSESLMKSVEYMVMTLDLQFSIVAPIWPIIVLL